MSQRDTHDWYRQLQKPAWAPSQKVFGPVWSFLYLLIAISFATVFARFYNGAFGLALTLPFALNLVFNLSFTPLQFWLKNNFYACIDIFLVLITLVWGMIAVRHVEPWIFFIQIPYLLWVTFATVLQVEITWMNRTSR